MNNIQSMAMGITLSGVAASFIIMIASWIRLCRANGFAASVPWMIVLPAPWTKAMYVFMLFLVSRSADPQIGEKWFLGTACVLAFVALGQAMLYSRRLAKERVGAHGEAGWWQNAAASMVPAQVKMATEHMIKLTPQLMLLGIIETFAIAAFVLTLTIGRHGMNTGNAAARGTGRIVGGLSASFVKGAVEGAKDAVNGGKEAQAEKHVP